MNPGELFQTIIGNPDMVSPEHLSLSIVPLMDGSDSGIGGVCCGRMMRTNPMNA